MTTPPGLLGLTGVRARTQTGFPPPRRWPARRRGWSPDGRAPPAAATDPSLGDVPDDRPLEAAVGLVRTLPRHCRDGPARHRLRDDAARVGRLAEAGPPGAGREAVRPRRDPVPQGPPAG